VLDGVEYRGHGLGFVDEHEVGPPRLAEVAALCHQVTRMGQVTRPLPRVGKVDRDGGILEQRPQQRRLPGLPGAEQQMDVRPSQSFREQRSKPAIEHGFTILALLEGRL
jgi:hypothetical protein